MSAVNRPLQRPDGSSELPLPDRDKAGRPDQRLLDRDGFRELSADEIAARLRDEFFAVLKRCATERG